MTNTEPHTRMKRFQYEVMGIVEASTKKHAEKLIRRNILLNEVDSITVWEI